MSPGEDKQAYPEFTLGSIEEYQGGEIISEEGTSTDSIYLILTGNVEISVMAGKKKFFIELLGEGEVFGEITPLGDAKQRTTARAIGRTVVGRIDTESIEKELNKLSADFKSILMATLGRYKKLSDRAFLLTYRNESRIEKTISLTYQDKKSESRSAWVKAKTANLSMGGLFISTHKLYSHLIQSLCICFGMNRFALDNDDIFFQPDGQ